MHLTQIITILMEDGKNKIHDPSSEEGQTIAWAEKTYRDARGVEFTKAALRREDNTVMHLFVGWENVEVREKFKEQPEYHELLKKAAALSAKPPSIQFAHLAPSPRLALDAPVTEIVFCHMPLESATEEAMDSYAKDWQKFHEETKKAGEGLQMGHSEGWILQEVHTDKVPGGKARTFVSVMGWKSLKAHTEEFRNHEDFKKAVHLIRGGPVLEMFHIEQQ